MDTLMVILMLILILLDILEKLQGIFKEKVK